MGTEQLRELKRLQKENERLRRAVSDLTLDKLILREVASGVMACIDHVRSQMKNAALSVMRCITCRSMGSQT